MRTDRMTTDDLEDIFPGGVIMVRREMEYDAQDAIRIARAKNDGLDPTMDDIMDVVMTWVRQDFQQAIEDYEMKYLNLNEEELDSF